MSKYNPPPGQFPHQSNSTLIQRCLNALPTPAQQDVLMGMAPDQLDELPKKQRDALIKIALDLGAMPRPSRAARALSDVNPGMLDPAGRLEAEAVLGTKIVGGKIIRTAPMPVRPDRRFA